MKKYSVLFLLFALFSISAAAQKVPKPSLSASDSTEAQTRTIGEGITLHDEKKYDDAIKKYEEVLKENPDNTVAMYEMAFSYFSKGDKPKALETAMKGAQYKSKQLVRFYTIIASVWDSQGNSADAIKLYEDAIKLGEKDQNYSGLSYAYFNLGVTYATQKQYEKSRQILKKAVEADFSHPGSNYYLAEIYFGTKYKVPALLAASRLISLELNTGRTKRAVTIFLDTLKSAKKDDKTGNINIFLDFNAPKDEGDFAMYDLILGTLTTVRDEKKDKGKTDSEIFADAVDTLIALMEEDKELKKTFVGKTYIPYLAEMKKKSHSKTFAYLVLQQSGDKEAGKWLTDNNQKAVEFMNWSKSYQLAK